MMEHEQKKKRFRLGVSGKMILNVAVPAVLILFVLAVIVIVTVVNTVWGLKNKDIENCRFVKHIGQRTLQEKASQEAS